MPPVWRITNLLAQQKHKSIGVYLIFFLRCYDAFWVFSVLHTLIEGNDAGRQLSANKFHSLDCAAAASPWEHFIMAGGSLCWYKYNPISADGHKIITHSRLNNRNLLLQTDGRSQMRLRFSRVGCFSVAVNLWIKKLVGVCVCAPFSCGVTLRAGALLGSKAMNYPRINGCIATNPKAALHSALLVFSLYSISMRARERETPATC